MCAAMMNKSRRSSGSTHTHRFPPVPERITQILRTDQSIIDMRIVDRVEVPPGVKKTFEYMFPGVEKCSDIMSPRCRENNEVLLYSITAHDVSDLISQITLSMDGVNPSMDVVDMTAGAGGNTVNYAKIFSHVTAIEIDSIRFNVLSRHVECLDIQNVDAINGDSISIVKAMARRMQTFNAERSGYDIAFIDPPWGYGGKYKNYENIWLYINTRRIDEIVIRDFHPIMQRVVMKVPFNFNVTEFDIAVRPFYATTKYMLDDNIMLITMIRV